ncbi:hypothetical protein BH09BAC5_BH09BAC5_05310 [soil metagenome]
MQPDQTPKQNFSSRENRNERSSISIIFSLLITIAAVILLVVLIIPNSKKNTKIDPRIESMLLSNSMQLSADTAKTGKVNDSTKQEIPKNEKENIKTNSVAKNSEIFYIGVANPITLSIEGFSADQLSPTLSGGSIENAGSPGKYNIFVSGGTQAVLSVSAKENGKTSKVETHTYKIERLPDPVTYFGNQKGNCQMSKTQILKQSKLDVKIEHFNLKTNFTVLSFILSINSNGTLTELKSTGPALTSAMKTALADTKSGDQLIFDKVIVKGPDGALRKITGVTVTVK